MGEIGCDLLTGKVGNFDFCIRICTNFHVLTGTNIFCAFVRFCNTTHEKITKIRSPGSYTDFNERVTHIVFYKGTLPTFPTELGEIFPNVKYLDFFECSMESIHKTDLKPFPKLEKLKLEANKLKFLPHDLFDFTPKITTLNFAKNQIKAIGETFLDNLMNLREVDFSDNPNIDYKGLIDDSDDFDKLKQIIINDCKPLRSLKDLTIDVLMKSTDKQNGEEVKYVAKCLQIEKLSNYPGKRIVKVLRLSLRS